MKFNPILLISLLLSATVTTAQQEPDFRVYLNTSTISPPAAISEQEIGKINSRRSTAPVMRVMQFNSIPGAAERAILKQAGVELLDYIPNNAYTVIIRGGINAADLKRAGVRSLFQLNAQQKMQPGLSNGQFPAWALRLPGVVDCWISFPKTFTAVEVKEWLTSLGFTVRENLYTAYRILAVQVAANRISELASLDYVEYVQAAPKEDVPLNDDSRVNSKVNVLQDPAGRNLDGSGVVIGVGDNADPLMHIDLAGRVINRSSQIGGAHGIHVMGTLAGAGIISEQRKGMAPGATVLAQAFSNIIAYAPAYVHDNNMVVTNNSYGNVVDDCNSFGVYDLYSKITDQQAFELPHLQHVFAAGNSGTIVCAGYPAGFGNVLGAFQSAKNNIVTGNGTNTYVLHASSSRGPVRDGRIKPEIIAQGAQVFSTGPSDTYYYNTGTSMASPAVAGGVALLYQRYRQLHSNQDPLNGLMKALLLNGAEDKGNPGPDFRYGFGWMNLSRSVRMLEHENYFISDVSNAGVSTHTINITDNNLALLKVMLYWNDSAAAVNAAHTLVNDLDLEVSGPSGVINYPQLLDTTKANLDNNAVTGADHINNAEQVVISNPVSGTYTFAVRGTRIPSGTSHGYYLVFDTIATATTLTFPAGGEHLVPGDALKIAWDAYGNNAGTFDLLYSPDDGTTWSAVQTGVTAGQRLADWTVPAVATDQARIRVMRNGTGQVSTSDRFTILGEPTISFSSAQCAGYVGLSWTATTGATDYEVMMLRSTTMKQVAVTTDLSYVVSGLNPDSSYYFTVRARINGHPGRRASAISKKPASGICAGTVSDHDLRMDAITSPWKSGRRFTSTSLSATTGISVRIANLDDETSTGDVQVAYRINGGAWNTELFADPAIAANGSTIITLSTAADLSAPGSYDLEVALTHAGDGVAANDTLKKYFRQIDNEPVDLDNQHTDDFEGMPVVEYTGEIKGLDGAPRFDFSASGPYGRLRSYVNEGIAEGSRALTLDSWTYNAAGTSDTLVATYNLSGYNVASDNIRIDFLYKHHGQFDYPTNRCWVRGSDSDPWIALFDVAANQADAGVFVRSPSLELSRTLATAGQQFSSSTQVRWGQFGQFITADEVEAAGYTFDRIHLYNVLNDVEMAGIEAPLPSGCALGSGAGVKVAIRNTSSSQVSTVPVFFQVDGGVVSSAVVPVINAGQTISYTFPATADFSNPGLHQLVIWCQLPGDSYPLNDTVRTTIHNSPVIAQFPYLQDFEQGDGYWYPGGLKSSWEYGTPASQAIKRAASGSKAWKTSLDGHYNDGELSYLYSPCFDLNGLASPMISFHVALDIEDCGASLCDAAYLEISTDGVSWSRLGTAGNGTNFYNRVYGGEGVWSVQDFTRWHVATSAITVAGNLNSVRFRFVMKSDPFVGRDGIAIDDIHIYEGGNGIYTNAGGESQSVNITSASGSGWINFADNGKLVASVNPQGQDLGSTDVKAYINDGAVRSGDGQYYHDRNITIKPAQTRLAAPAKVRIYFTDAEMEAMINATGCAGCVKPSMACELGMSKYSDDDKSRENGTMGDDDSGRWAFFNSPVVKIVPYDIGYYAEIDVINFSEFWLNTGGVKDNQVAAIAITGFSVYKINADQDVRVEWSTPSEENVAKYVVEVARSNEAYERNEFDAIGEVAAIGNSNTTHAYSFDDAEAGKTGVRYYRLRATDLDGRVTYSIVQPIVFGSAVSWNAYPNPSAGLFHLVYQWNVGEPVFVRVFNLTGRQVNTVKTFATGFVQKTEVDLSPGRFAPGIYLCEIRIGGSKKTFRLLKR